MIARLVRWLGSWLQCNVSREFFALETDKDMVYETINIMYDCHSESYDGYEIYSLVNAGVNIINVDMTLHDTEYFQKIKGALELAQKIPENVPSAYKCPIGLSVTISATKPIDVDERARKPIFYMNPSIAEDYYKCPDNNRNLLIQVRDLITNKFDGIIIKYRGDELPIECMQAFVRATEVLEKNTNPTTEYFDKSSPVGKRAYGLPDGKQSAPPMDTRNGEVTSALPTFEGLGIWRFRDWGRGRIGPPLLLPVLQPYTAALAASIAAVTCGARAIFVFTTTGSSAKDMSCASPPCYVFAITRSEKTARKMHLYRKVMPLLYQDNKNTRDLAHTVKILCGP
ncbi:unnamed protein product [Spodoptera exigua]|nr:unnamed protein product [Spodoptera exigua]